jgi:KaiC/GvpD/RAD55 family RecA-like ATPase/PKD repeat protein
MKLSSLTKSIHFSIPFSMGRAASAVILVLMLFAICGFFSPVAAKQLSVTISPSQASMDVGQAQLFTSNVTGGTSPYSYQWYLDYVPVSGATNETWAFSPTTPGSYTVYVHVTDSSHQQMNAQSNNATVTVNGALSVTIAPSSVTLDVGQSQTFTSTVSGGTGPYSYQWYLDGSAVSGATSSTWTYAPSSSGSHTVYVKVTDSVSAVATSNTATVTVNGALFVTIAPSSVTLDVGQSQTFNSTVTGGTSSFSYQWYLDGSAVSGATSSSWTCTPSASGSHTVYIKVTDSVSSVATSNTAAVTVDSALSASISPSTVTLDVGQSQTFTSTVSGGTVPYSCQWYLDGSAVSGATSSTWTCTASSSGTHTVYVGVTDSATTHVTATSNTASVTVSAALSVTISPSTVTLDVGQSQLFTPTVSGGTSPFSYQWYLNGVAVLGATSASWTFTPTSAGSQTVYVVVTDSANTHVSATSNTAHVTANPQLAVTISPLTSTIYLSQNQTYISSVGGTGAFPYSYHWYLNDSAVSGATSSTWTYTPTATGTYQIYVKVTDGVGEVATSFTATLTVTPKPSMTVTISPNSAAIDLSQSIPFTSSVTGGIGPYTYQWYLNGIIVPGATSSTWVFTPASTGNYQVYLNVTDSLNVKAKSNTAYVTVKSLATVSISPSSVVIDVGQYQAFTSTVSGGTGPFSYQWYLDGVAVLGAASSSWVYAPSSGGSHTVYVEVTDSMNSIATSSTATVTVNAAFSVTIAPSSVTLDVGQSQTFNSTVTGGTSSFSYQWYLDGSAVSGATSSTWTCTASSSGTHTVYVDVTDSATTHVTATSNTASVTVDAALLATIAPSWVTLDVGQSQLFTPTVSGGTSPFSYQWYLNGLPISGATTATWAFTPSTSGSYKVYVNVTDDVGSRAASGISSINVNPALSPPVAQFTESANEVYTDVLIQFNASLSNDTDGTIISYGWNFGDGRSTTGEMTSHSYAEDGNYTVVLTVKDSDGLVGLHQDTVHVLNRTPNASFTSSSITAHSNETITFNATSSYDPDGRILSYFWDFGDQLNATGVVVNHAYVQQGNYTVKLTTTDNDGSSKTTSAFETIRGARNGSLHPSFDWIRVVLLIVPLSILPFAGFILKRRRNVRKNYMGFEHFDEITCGGIPDSSSVLVIGGPGSGKSILCEELAYSFLFKDRLCLYLAYDSFPDEIRESLKKFGQETSGYEERKQFLFMDCYSSNASVKSKEEYSLSQPFSLTDLGITLTEATDEMGTHLRVILDSIVPLLTHVEPSKVIEFLQDRSARIKGINGIFVFTAGKETIKPSLANRLEEAVDCIIELEVSTDTGKTVRKLRVKKMRGRKTSEKWVQFKIDPSKGIVFSA